MLRVRRSELLGDAKHRCGAGIGEDAKARPSAIVESIS
jgi:hypothetical protein